MGVLYQELESHCSLPAFKMEYLNCLINLYLYIKEGSCIKLGEKPGLFQLILTVNYVFWFQMFVCFYCSCIGACFFFEVLFEETLNP